MRAFSHRSLSVAVVRASNAIQLHFRGRGIERDPERALALYLAHAVDAAADASTLLELRFEELTAFNAGAVDGIVRCLDAARARAVAVRIVYDGDLEWQRTCFEPLRAAAADGLLELCPLGSREAPRLRAQGS